MTHIRSQRNAFELAVEGPRASECDQLGHLVQNDEADNKCPKSLKQTSVLEEKCEVWKALFH